MDDRTFAQCEREGWQRNAAAYDEIVVPATSQASASLVNSIGNPHGRRVLDLACGTGELAERLAACGAVVVGIDIAPNMVDLARRRIARGAEFCEGDAEALSFGDGSFDAVVCNFGFPHFPDPERALREVHRVLRPGGTCALTVWQSPEKGNEFFRLILGIYQKHAQMQVGLPPAPPLFALADGAIHEPMLTRAGLGDVRATEIAVAWPLRGPETVFEFVLKGAVRTRMLYERQTPAVQQCIRGALIAETEAHLGNGMREIPCPAVLVLARKRARSAGDGD